MTGWSLSGDLNRYDDARHYHEKAIATYQRCVDDNRLADECRLSLGNTYAAVAGDSHLFPLKQRLSFLNEGSRLLDSVDAQKVDEDRLKFSKLHVEGLRGSLGRLASPLDESSAGRD